VFLAFACSRPYSIQDDPAVEELLRRSSQYPRPELEDPKIYRDFETLISFVTKSEFPLTWLGSIPIISGRVNGRGVRFVPDTGSFGPHVILDAPSALRCDIYIPDLDWEKSFGKQSPNWMLLGFADRIDIGEIEYPRGAPLGVSRPFSSFLPNRAEEKNLLSEISDLGVYTQSALGLFHAVWDFPDDRLFLYAPDSDFPLPPDAVKIQHRTDAVSKKIWIQVQVGTQALELFLDTGSENVIIPQKALEGMEYQKTGWFRLYNTMQGPSRAFQKAKIKEIRLGEVVLSDVEVIVLPDDEEYRSPTINAFALREFKLIVLAEGKEIYLVP